MIITNKAIPRRTILKGLGTALALPLLDGMVPALGAQRRTVMKPVTRLGVMYVPHGAIMNHWTPTTEGKAFEYPSILKPIERFRDQVMVLSGLDNKQGLALAGEPAGGHGRIGASFLTGVHAKPTEGADFEAGISYDQIAAAKLGQETQLASLELSLESTEFAGACDAGFSCAYVNTLCWRSPTVPLPMENNPRAAFERLFGDSDSTDKAVRLARIQSDRSILDSVTDKVSALQRELWGPDSLKLSEYLESIRDVERRIQKAEVQGARELPAVHRPLGAIPAAFEDYAKLMLDLQVLAYQADLTRVVTFMVGKELSGRSYPEIGVSEGHHALSHHQDVPDKLERLARINVLHAQLLVYFLDKLQTTADGDGTLLDQVALIYGSGMSNSNLHLPLNLPVLLVGGGAGRTGGRHVRYPEGTPVTNLFLTLLNKVGVEAERIGDSTGAFQQLSEV
jgi:hypothetical protein